MSVTYLHPLKTKGFTNADIDRAERFGRDIAALYAYIDVENGVITPRGQATLLSVREGVARVLLTRGKATRQRKNREWYVPSLDVDPKEVRPA